MENNNGKERVAIHERLVRLETQVEAILENHLPHIQKSINRVNNKFWAVIVLLIANLVTLIVNLIT